MTTKGLRRPERDRTPGSKQLLEQCAADYQQGEAERLAGGYKFVCPACPYARLSGASSGSVSPCDHGPKAWAVSGDIA